MEQQKIREQTKLRLEKKCMRIRIVLKVTKSLFNVFIIEFSRPCVTFCDLAWSLKPFIVLSGLFGLLWSFWCIMAVLWSFKTKY